MNGAKITREWEHHWIEVIFLVALWLEAEKNGTQSSGDTGIPLIVVSKAMMSWAGSWKQNRFKEKEFLAKTSQMNTLTP